MRNILPSLRGHEPGFSYLMVMIALTLIGLSMTMAARQWKTMVQRELEADLLAKGIEIQAALALYSASAKAGRVVPGEIYPQTLADLTRPPRPFLRKVYLDPVGHSEWELLRAPTGGIMGVRSKSRQKPIKQSDFPLLVRHFQGKPTHYDWVFQHPNPSMVAVAGYIPRAFPVPGKSSTADQSIDPRPVMPSNDPTNSVGAVPSATSAVSPSSF